MGKALNDTPTTPKSEPVQGRSIQLCSTRVSGQRNESPKIHQRIPKVETENFENHKYIILVISSKNHCSYNNYQ